MECSVREISILEILSFDQAKLVIRTNKYRIFFIYNFYFPKNVKVIANQIKKKKQIIIIKICFLTVL